MTRKIIQISASRTDLVALCDDHTLWRRFYDARPSSSTRGQVIWRKIDTKEVENAE